MPLADEAGIVGVVLAGVEDAACIAASDDGWAADGDVVWGEWAPDELPTGG